MHTRRLTRLAGLLFLGWTVLAGATVRAQSTLEIVFTYGSEKEAWVKEVTTAFNAEQRRSSSGKVIVVKALPMGSGDCVDEVLTEQRKAHLISPASGAYIALGNARSQADKKGDLVEKPKNVVLSPVVIAMWKPMADALRKNKKEIGWADILALSKDPKGWGSVGNPQWGEFRFAHTHPEYSNSGLIAVLAEIYAAVGTKEEPKLDDLKKKEVGEFVEGIEKSVVHYGSSTGFFSKKMAVNGMSYLSAAVLYENLVIEANNEKLEEPLVAIYPKEGTFWCDHPVAIVKRDWVTEEHQKACSEYVKYLTEKPQQKKAVKMGFRPVLESKEVPLDAPFDAAHGVNPDLEPEQLPLPSVEVLEAMLGLWRKHKKPSRVLLVVDTSGSMRADEKMVRAKSAARNMVKMLGERDTVALVPFSDKVWGDPKDLRKMDPEGKVTLDEALRKLTPRGETALYDAIDVAHQYLQANPRADTISAIIVLSDGDDNRSTIKLEELLKKIKVDYEKVNIRVFTIAYGDDAKPDILKKIAEATQAKEYQGDSKTILDILKDIATFF